MVKVIMTPLVRMSNALFFHREVWGVLMTADKTARPEQLKFAGRILFLTEDTSLIRQQLEAAGDERERLEADSPVV